MMDSIRYRTRGAAAATCLLGALVACSSDKDESEKSSEPARSEPVERLAERSVKVSEKNVERGEKLYVERCATCHADKGKGRVGIAPSLTSKTFLQAASDPMLIETIQKGREGTTMVPWGLQLPREDVKAIVAYLRSLTPTKPATLDESQVTGDAERGEQIFLSICSNCHGRTGAGYQESGSGTGIGRKAFLESVSNGYLRHVIEHGKSGTGMRPFAEDAVSAVANLNDQQIEDVIMYLRKNAW